MLRPQHHAVSPDKAKHQNNPRQTDGHTPKKPRRGAYDLASFSRRLFPHTDQIEKHNPAHGEKNLELRANRRKQKRYAKSSRQPDIALIPDRRKQNRQKKIKDGIRDTLCQNRLGHYHRHFDGVGVKRKKTDQNSLHRQKPKPLSHSLLKNRYGKRRQQSLFQNHRPKIPDITEKILI